jgi:hypothetical protein
MGLWSDLKGITGAILQFGIGGANITNNSGTIDIKNAANNAYAPIKASLVSCGDEILEINSSAAGAGADWKYRLLVPTSGMTAAVDLTLPVDDGTPNQLLGTDGSGNLSFMTAGVTTDCIHSETTSLAWDTGVTTAMFTSPASSIIEAVEVIIDTSFDGTAPSMSVGITGTVSKYMPATAVNLAGTAKDRYIYHPGEAASAGEDLKLTFTAGGGASAGAARVIVYYTIPA